MDDQLKQRLVGATIIVALVVALVPLLFDESPAPVSVTADSPEVPPVPETAAATPGEPADEGEGYRIIPLTETAGPEAAAAVAKPDEQVPAASETPAEFLGDEGAEAVEVPTPDSPLGQGARGPAQVVATPEKTRAERGADTSPSRRDPERAAGSRSVADAGSPKPGSVSSKATGSRAKAPPVAPNVAAKPTAEKAPATAGAVQSGSTAKPSAAAEPARRHDKKSSQRPVESPKPAAVAKPATTLPAPKKKPEPANKAASTETEPDGADPASPGASAAVPAKMPSHAKSMVARKPKGDEGATRWVVQTYSFTNEANAKSLVEKLRKAKFDAFIETVPGSGGVNYRVSVGPEPDRGRAEQARKRLESSVGMNGIVTGRK